MRVNTSTLLKQPNTLLRAFPPPQYLCMPAVGIDISDYSTKYALFHSKGEKIELASYGKLDIPAGVVEKGDIKQPDTLAKILAQLKRTNGFQFVHFSLPEEHAYLFQTDVPRDPSVSFEQAIEFRLKENVPISPEEATFDYTVVKETDTVLTLNVSVYPTSHLLQYVSVFEEADLVPLSAEIEGQASARSLLDDSEKGTIFILDIGRSEASLAIVHNGLLAFTATLDHGGDDMTRAIAQKLGVSYQEAEKLKREEGFVRSKEASSVYQAMLPTVEALKDAIEKHNLYWQMHSVRENVVEDTISRVVLAGGNANIRGLPEYFENALDVTIEMGDVWRNVFSVDDVIPPIHYMKSFEYATAIGLGLRSVLRSR